MDEIMILDKFKSVNELLLEFFPNCKIKYDLRYPDDYLRKTNIKKLSYKQNDEGELIEIDLKNCNGNTVIDRDYYILVSLVKALYGNTGDSLDVTMDNVSCLDYKEMMTIKQYYGFSHLYSQAFIEISKLLPRDKKAQVKQILSTMFKVPLNLLEAYK